MKGLTSCTSSNNLLCGKYSKGTPGFDESQIKYTWQNIHIVVEFLSKTSLLMEHDDDDSEWQWMNYFRRSPASVLDYRTSQSKTTHANLLDNFHANVKHSQQVDFLQVLHCASREDNPPKSLTTTKTTKGFSFNQYCRETNSESSIFCYTFC